MINNKKFVVVLSLVVLFILSTVCSLVFGLKDLKKTNASRERHRFVVFVDTRGSSGEAINEDSLIQILKEIQNLIPQPEYIILPGDLVRGSSKIDKLESQLVLFKELFSSYFPIEMLLPTVGNHEVGSDPEDDQREKVFAEVFSEFKPDEELDGYNRTAYYVDLGNIRFIVLNSYHYGESNKITGRQFEWFKKVAEAPIDHKFVFLHSSPYPTGAHIGSSLDENLELRDRFWEVIDKNNVDIVFAGHEHNYSRRIIDSSFDYGDYHFERSINQIITGSAGAKLNDTYSDSKGVVVPPIPIYHYMVVDVQGKIVNATAFSIDGDVIDEFTLRR